MQKRWVKRALAAIASLRSVDLVSSNTSVNSITTWTRSYFEAIKEDENDTKTFAQCSLWLMGVGERNKRLVCIVEC